jgi:ATP-dependent Clp protease ATP-binding subunit ClpB
MNARRLIAEHGYDPVYGARPLRRYLARELETRIGRALLSGELREGAVIRVGVRDGELRVTFADDRAIAS